MGEPENGTFDADFAIIGSGFGGSVSALRLSEKGYKVVVVERGKRWNQGDFPKSNWNVFKSIWMPLLWCFGIQRLTLLSDVMVLSGSGVGGGSLVYANTLLVPPKPFFVDPQWREMGDWQAHLRAASAVNPHSEHIPVARVNGITSAGIMPSSGIIGPRGAVLDLLQRLAIGDLGAVGRIVAALAAGDDHEGIVATGPRRIGERIVERG